jgi:hypothetical protein
VHRRTPGKEQTARDLEPIINALDDPMRVNRG